MELVGVVWIFLLVLVFLEVQLVSLLQIFLFLE